MSYGAISLGSLDLWVERGGAVGCHCCGHVLGDTEVLTVNRGRPGGATVLCQQCLLLAVDLALGRVPAKVAG